MVAGFIFFLSSLSHPSVPKFQYSDKVFHVIAYSTLGFFLVRSMRPWRKNWTWLQMALFGAIGCLLYGVSDEFHQHFVPPRSVELMDVVADGVGGLIGGVLTILCPKFLR